MKLEEGKFYKTRDGRKVGPLVKNYDLYEKTHPFAFVGETYRLDGSTSVADNEYDEDIVSEWPTPSIPSPIATETVTRMVPGVYGRLSIAKQNSEDGRRILIGLANEVGALGTTHHGWSFDELCAAIEVLTAVKTHLENTTKENTNGR